MKRFLLAAAAASLLAGPVFADAHMKLRDGSVVLVAPVYGNPFQVDRSYTVDGYKMFDGQLTADDLTDAELYSTISGDEIGEVEDVIIEGGKIASYILEVGGFLDIGDAEVAVPADQVMVMRNDDGDTRVYVQATEEQLEEYPKYDYAD